MAGEDPLDPLVTAAQQATRRAAADAVEPVDWDDAVAAWDAVLAAVVRASIPVGLEAVLLDRAAGARLQRSWCGGSTAGADAAAAADLYRRATKLAPSDSPDRRAYLNNLGRALRTVWERERRPGVLDEAVSAHGAAVDASDLDTPAGLTTRLQLGKTLRERYDETHDEDDLTRAVHVLSEALGSSARVTAAQRAECLETLGNALYDHYAVTGDRAELEESVRSLRAALDLVDPSDVDRADFGSNLASAMVTRFAAGGDPDDLAQAITLLEEALAEREARGGLTAELLSNLGNAFGVRAGLVASPADADEAVSYLRRAVDLAAGTARAPGILSNLAAALLERFDLTGQIADLDESIDLLDAAVAGSALTDPEHPSRLNNLGNALRRRTSPFGIERRPHASRSWRVPRPAWAEPPAPACHATAADSAAIRPRMSAAARPLA